MPVVHIRGNAIDRDRASHALVSVTAAVAEAVPCPVESVWCTFVTVETQTVGGAPRDGDGRIVYVEAWMRPREDDTEAISRCLEAACVAAADGFGVPIDDVWGTLRPVEARRVFAGGSLIDG